MDETTLSPLGHGDEALCQAGGHSARCCLGKPGNRTAEANHGWRSEISWGSRFLQLSGAKKVQTARARVSQPLSGIYSVLGMRRREVAARSPAGTNLRQKHL